jgi:hypothetical protein
MTTAGRAARLAATVSASNVQVLWTPAAESSAAYCPVVAADPTEFDVPPERVAMLDFQNVPTDSARPHPTTQPILDAWHRAYPTLVSTGPLGRG